MHIELLQPMKFGTGEFKPGETVDVAHPLAGDLVRTGRALYLKGTKERKAHDKALGKGKAKTKKTENKKTETNQQNSLLHKTF